MWLVQSEKFGFIFGWLERRFSNEIIYRLQNDPCPNSGCGNLLSENKDEATNENDEERDKNAHSWMQKSCSQNGQKASGGENANKNAL